MEAHTEDGVMYKKTKYRGKTSKLYKKNKQNTDEQDRDQDPTGLRSGNCQSKPY